ncbi:MAG: nucleotide exchange factor GrpE [Halanaerobiales bacterium]|nr:nucleotide exchange factor GrpE [Halanaerobiales bacterium]
MVSEENKNQEFENEEGLEENKSDDVKTDETVDLKENITEERLDQIKEELSTVTEEKDEYLNRLKRMKADFVNYRNRTKKEKSRIESSTKMEFINSILPVIDNFERALKSVDEDSEFLSGVQMIYKQLLDVLKKEGLEIIETEGQEFDPQYHEAIMQIESNDYESGYVVEEVQRGYIMEDKVVRPAMVKVAI